jgi:hypothetical protein
MWPALKAAANVIGPGGELVLWVALLLSFVQLIVVVLSAVLTKTRHDP